jgi:pyruvate kinase
MQKHRNTKIIATLGPASSAESQIEALVRAGVNVFRLNFSHGNHADHQLRYQAIRRVEEKLNTPIGVLLDLQGPKIRIGLFSREHETLLQGAEFNFDLDTDVGNGQRVCLPHPEVLSALCPGDTLLVDDGKLKFKVIECSRSHARTSVEVGGEISDRKGVNLPDTRLHQSVLTQKDRNDLAFGLALGVDWIAQSFVQHADDVLELRRLVNGRAGIVAKLEKPLAIDNLEEIVRVADAIMVARGDLGVEVPAEDVPILQRRIVRACRVVGKPVIIATQMLESMIHSPVPTRAETSDVATAVYDGVDAIMLSAESASGKYPLEAVVMMERIVRSVEADPLQQTTMRAIHTQTQQSAADAIGAAVRTITSIVPLAATLTYTTSGASALRIAHERPNAPIVGLTPVLATARKLALVWGVYPCVSPDAKDVETMVALALKATSELGLVVEHKPVAIVAGMPFGTPGSTNLVRLAWPTAGVNAPSPKSHESAHVQSRMRDPYFAIEPIS